MRVEDADLPPPNGAEGHHHPHPANAIGTSFNGPLPIAHATIDMEPDPSLGAAVFRSSREVLCERYLTDVRITVDAHGRRLDVLRDRWSGFSVVKSARDCVAEDPGRPKASTRRSPGWSLLAGAVESAGVALLHWRKTKS